MAWVYILTCSDGSYYVGSTRDLEARLEQHHIGHADAYTSKRRPLKLAWALEFERIDEAWMAERRLHGWSRAKKLALIDGRVDLLPALARNRTQFGDPNVATNGWLHDGSPPQDDP